MTAMPPSMFTRLRRTPLVDVLRGRLTCRLAWREEIEASGLPEELQGCIRNVVIKTGLWRAEKFEVAQELAAHFRDGLEAGVDAQTLRERFGDPKVAAKLIRRAKVRNRVWVWHAWRRSLQGVGLLILGYLALAIYLGMQSPHVGVDYQAKLNAASRAMGEGDKSWPSYRRAWIEHGMGGKETTGIRTLIGLKKAKESHIDPYGEWAGDWPLVSAWLMQNQPLLEALRQAAEKPALGFVFDEAYVREPENWKALMGGLPQPAEPAGQTATLAQRPGLGQSVMRTEGRLIGVLANSGRLLRCDMLDAGWQGDGRRVVADYKALLGIARHMGEPGFVLNQSLSVGAGCAANQNLLIIMSTQMDKLDDASLIELAHIAATGGPREAMSFKAEKMMLEDVIQRIYTDDGAGGGHMSVRGALISIGAHQRQMDYVDTQTTAVDDLADKPYAALARDYLLSPVALATHFTRRQATEFVDGYFAQAEEAAQQPMWTLLEGENAARDYYHAYEKANPPLLGVRIPSVFSSLAPIGLHGIGRWLFIAQTETICVVAALELHRRRTGRYPADLQALVPRYLPSLPLDHSTGLPLLLRYENGRPVVYGRGRDGKDDGGKLPELGPEDDETLSFLPSKDDVKHLDWVIYPVQIREATEK
jgi:hypothetical protein